MIPLQSTWSCKETHSKLKYDQNRKILIKHYNKEVRRQISNIAGKEKVLLNMHYDIGMWQNLLLLVIKEAWHITWIIIKGTENVVE